LIFDVIVSIGIYKPETLFQNIDYLAMLSSFYITCFILLNLFQKYM